MRSTELKIQLVKKHSILHRPLISTRLERFSSLIVEYLRAATLQQQVQYGLLFALGSFIENEAVSHKGT